MKKRAISVSNSEISIVIWIIGFFLAGYAIKKVWTLHNMILPINQGIAFELILVMMLLFGAVFLFAFSTAWINFFISKYELNLWIDKITNPDFMGWVRFTKNRRIRSQIVKKGALGLTKGVANDSKADVINNADYTVTLPNGNQAILTVDLFSENVNLEKVAGWQLLHRHFGFIGHRAYEKCIEDKETLFSRALNKNKGKDKGVSKND